MPPEFDNVTLWGRVNLWRPLGFDGGARQIRDNNWLNIIGRLKPGVSLGQAGTESAAIGGRLAKDYPRKGAGRPGPSMRVELWNDTRTSRDRAGASPGCAWGSRASCS